jgi:hypothetical protein
MTVLRVLVCNTVVLFFCCCPRGWIYKSSTYRQKAGKLAAGQYWKIGDDSYKQEAREDEFSVYCHFNSKRWWITCHPLLPPFKNPWLIAGSPNPETGHHVLPLVQWHCPFWQSDICPSMWVASNYEKHKQELNMCDERQRALEAAMQSLKEAAEAERVNAQVELQAVTKQILQPSVKSRGYMHVRPGAPAVQVKSGWMNKMVALLGAIQTADTDRMELLVAEFLIADRL